jgi:signal transduction histidine kinase
MIMLADGAQLRQLVLNLLLNAIDVTPRGGQILLEFQPEPARSIAEETSLGSWHRAARKCEEDWVVVRVSDTGPGLPPELHQRLFEPFVTTKETGTGLGLSICDQIVQCHGGAISARNRTGGGAVFEVRLPLDAISNPRPSPLSNAGKAGVMVPSTQPDRTTGPNDENLNRRE